MLLKELNCRIFRHGVYKDNYKQIDPHMKKDECDLLKEKGLIYGCSKPFKINFDGFWYAEICDYI